MNKTTLYLLLLLLNGILVCSSFASSVSNKWEDRIYEFEEEDMIWPPPKGATLFVGSSSIRLWKSLEEDFSSHDVINRGFGGAQTSDLLHFMDRIVLPYKPAQIIFYGGGNDIFSGKDPDVAVKNFREFVERVKAVLPKTHIYVLSMKPSPKSFHLWPKKVPANAARKAYADKTENVTYVDVSKVMFDENGKLREDIFSRDRVHMNAKGYALWVKVLKEVLGWND